MMDYQQRAAVDLVDEELVDALICEASGEDRWISTDPPMRTDEFRAELLSRLNSLRKQSMSAGSE